MAKNYCVVRSAKVKSVAGVKGGLDEMLPDELGERKSERADLSRTVENENSGTAEESFELYKKLLPENVRKNAVYALMFVVSTSDEFDDEDDEKRYYKKAREFIEKQFGQIFGWAIHRDETSTHMQVMTIPLVDGKLNARALIGGGKARLNKLQTDFYEEVGKEFGLSRGEEKSVARHKTVEEYHLEQQQKLDEGFKKLKTAQNELKTAQDELSVEKSKFAVQKAEFERNKAFFDYQKDFNDRATAVTEEMLTKNRLNVDTKPHTLVGALRYFIKKNVELVTKLNMIIQKPLDQISDMVQNAKKSGCRNLQEYLQMTEKRSSAQDMTHSRTDTKPHGRGR